ncbi:methyl-accepting chemotaxis protein [Oryzifoliimicrobium ureilyticus]|uniref:methyl-accepting chemotaxis protein n=1 Tax=Oryzifoliimicrobium ureilyticus TaxID=3113724 RepID=UPI003076025E
MSFLSNSKIRTKILTILIPACLIGIMGIVYVAYSYRSTVETYAKFINYDNAAEIEMARASTALHAVAYDTYQIYVYPRDDLSLPAILADQAANASEVVNRLRNARQLLPSEPATIGALSNRSQALLELFDRAVALSQQGKRDEARKFLMQVDPMVTTLRRDIGKMVTRVAGRISLDNVKMSSRANETILSSLIVLALVFAVAIFGALLISARGITGPIDSLRKRMLTLADGEIEDPIQGADRHDEVGAMARAVQVFKEGAIQRQELALAASTTRDAAESARLVVEAERSENARQQSAVVEVLARGLEGLSNGDLEHRILAPFPNEYEKLRNDFNGAIDKLQDAMRTVANKTSTIRTGATHIKAAADDLARRTQQQAASLEETAAALDEITTTVKKTADGALHAKSIVSQAKSDAEQSGEIVKRAIIAMGAIETSTTKVNHIIGVIDEIAFQTNLLALNAGVEAARAGDAGRGFAVVASEVRGLAQRSAEAAKQIKSLISESERQVEDGVALVIETGTALERIVGRVGEIDTIVADISNGTGDQAIGLQQVNTAVNEMDQVTQQNAAMVEEAAAASHGLAEDTEELSRLVFRFSVGAIGIRPQDEANHYLGRYPAPAAA